MEKTHLSFKSLQLREEAYPWLWRLADVDAVFSTPRSQSGQETIPVLRAPGFLMHALPI